MKRIVTLVNTLVGINSKVYSNHTAFWCHNIRKFPDVDFKFFTPWRMSIDMARNTAAKMALEYEAEYLLFIDDDVLIPTDTLEKLLAPDADIVAGVVPVRGYPFNLMAFKRVAGELPHFNELPKIKVEGRDDEVLKDPVTQDDGLAAVGFSCCLIKTSLLKRIPQPYFITGPRNTEDIYFCVKAHEILERLKINDPTVQSLKIALATSVQPGHLLDPQPIEYSTIDVYKELFETLVPGITVEQNQGKRDINYIKANMAKL